MSQWLGKVLNQLSLTSWMPAGMLVGVGALIIALHIQIATDPAGGFDLGKAISALTDNVLGTALVLLVAVILAATVTQAFAFGTIRVLEGYWSGTGPSGKLLRKRTSAMLRRRTLLEKQARQQWRAVFEGSRLAMRQAGIAPSFIAVMEDDFNSSPDIESSHLPEVIEAARKIPWLDFAPPALLQAAEATKQQLSEFPHPHRVLPTKLGNVIRSREDALVKDGYDLEGFVMRRYAQISPRLLAQHDDFRTRLDMYCTFVPVFVLLAVLAASLLSWPGGHYWIALAASTAFFCLSILSYRAAVASARGYTAALKAISVAAVSTA